MEKWQMEYLEKYKENVINIKERKLMLVDRGIESTSSIYHEGLGILFISFDKKSDVTVKTINIAMEYWEEFANRENLQMIIVDYHNVYWKKEQFHRLGYHILPDHLKEIISKGRFFKQLAKGSQKQITKKFKTIIDELEQKKQKESLFIYELDEKITISEIKIYYKGYYGKINVEYENGLLVICFEDEKFYLREENDLKTTFDSIFKKIKNKMRIKNHFEIPRKFFEEKMSSHSKETRDYIHQSLLKTYSWEEIEKYFYEITEKQLKGKTINKLLKPKVHEVMGFFFVIDNEMIYSFNTDEKEKAMEKYKEIITRKASKEAEEQFKSTFN